MIQLWRSNYQNTYFQVQGIIFLPYNIRIIKILSIILCMESILMWYLSHGSGKYKGGLYTIIIVHCKFLEKYISCSMCICYMSSCIYWVEKPVAIIQVQNCAWMSASLGISIKYFNELYVRESFDIPLFKIP